MLGRNGNKPIAVVRMVSLCLFLGLHSGCLEKRIQWSPDGTRAAIITADGLFLTDPFGNLESISSPSTVYALAWLSDSQQMVVAGRTAGDTWLGVGRISGTELILRDDILAAERVVDIRVAPGDGAFAFTVETESFEFLELFAAPIDGSQRPALVSRRAAAYPDWSADGRSLFYMEAEAGVQREERLHLGSLVGRQLVNDDGTFSLSEPPTFVAGLAFETYARVRCLTDGRLIFNAHELALPYSTSDFGGYRQQLFMAATKQLPTLVRLIPRAQQHRLPESLGQFEVSPDETEILFATTAGGVFRLTLATGQVQVIQTAAAAKMKVSPVWRATGEITYVKIPESEASDLRSVAVVLQRGGESLVLSAGWPARPAGCADGRLTPVSRIEVAWRYEKNR